MSKKIETLLEINGKVYGGQEIDLILLGRGIEKERIIKLLEANFHRFDLSNNGVDYPMGLDEFVALIKGETNE